MQTLHFGRNSVGKKTLMTVPAPAGRQSSVPGTTDVKNRRRSRRKSLRKEFRNKNRAKTEDIIREKVSNHQKRMSGPPIPVQQQPIKANGALINELSKKLKKRSPKAGGKTDSDVKNYDTNLNKPQNMVLKQNEKKQITDPAKVSKKVVAATLHHSSSGQETSGPKERDETMNASSGHFSEVQKRGSLQKRSMENKKSRSFHSRRINRSSRHTRRWR